MERTEGNFEAQSRSRPMTDLRKTIIPKSDQLNADDLIGQTMTIRVTKVSLLTEADQPIAINFEGDNGKPFKPCKSMRRVMVTVWGPDGNAYIGRSMTLYRDEKVMFGGLAVGGIRISHMTDIDAPVTMALTATRANKKPYTVKPLKVDNAPRKQSAPAQPHSPPQDDAILDDPSDYADKFEHTIDTATDGKEYEAMKTKAKAKAAELREMV